MSPNLWHLIATLKVAGGNLESLARYGDQRDCLYQRILNFTLCETSSVSLIRYYENIDVCQCFTTGSSCTYRFQSGK